MLILFIKRLFLRVTAAVWILLLLCNAFTIFGIPSPSSPSRMAMM